MAEVLIQVDVNDTQALLGAILTHVNADQRVQFLCDPGMGGPIMQRVRVKLSRVRKKLNERGRPKKHFKLHHDIYPYSKDGKRHDCVVVWRTRNLRHSISETLEDLIGNGNSI
jgi:hypothetical protein